MNGMNDAVIEALMKAIGNVNDDEDGKKGKKMSVNVIDVKPGDDIDYDPMRDEKTSPPEMMEGMSDDDYLAKLKEMHPEEGHGEMPTDDWSPEDMESMHGPSMMMQLASLKGGKKKKMEEDEGDHEYR